MQNILVTSPIPGELRVTGNFIDGSTAIGVAAPLILIHNNLTGNPHAPFISKWLHKDLVISL